MGCASSKRQGSEGPRDALQKMSTGFFGLRKRGESSPRVRRNVFELEAESNARRRQCSSLQQNLVRDVFRVSVYEVYEVSPDAQLGEGRFGKVTCGTHKKTGSKYAIKTIAIGDAVSDAALEEFMQEIDIHKSLDHPNIARLQEVYCTESTIFMVMDLCSGGDLLSRFEARHAKGEKTYCEANARDLILKITAAIRYCHDRGITHRDLKLENIVYESNDPDAAVKVVDFGLSAHFKPDKNLRAQVGTCYYQSPEVLKGWYSNACDMWSIGVIAYMLLGGQPPFTGATDEGVRLQVRWSKFKFIKPAFNTVSASAKDFISKLLEKNVKKRLTAEAALKHAWLASDSPSNTQHHLSTEVLASLQRFRDLGKLHRVALEVVARSLEQSQIDSLKAEFEKVDRDGRGEITRAAFIAAVADVADKDYAMTSAAAGSMFDDLDINKKGTMPFNTFLAGALAIKQLDEARVQQAFDHLDTRHRGYIAVDDLCMITGGLVPEAELQKFVREVGGGGGTITNAQFVNLMVRSLSAVNVASLGGDVDTPRGAGGAGASDAPTQPATTFRSMVQSASKLALVKLGLAKEHEEKDARSNGNAAGSVTTVSNGAQSNGQQSNGHHVATTSETSLDPEQLRLAEEAERYNNARQHQHFQSLSNGNIEVDGVLYDGIEF